MGTGRRVVWMVLGWTLIWTACGGDGRGKLSKADWETRHGESLAALDRELVAADLALDDGDRNGILGACNLLDDALAVVRDEALPVPHPPVDTALRDAVVDIEFAVRSCLVGGRSTAAIDVEAAMALMDDARHSFDRVQVAVAAWT